MKRLVTFVLFAIMSAAYSNESNSTMLTSKIYGGELAHPGTHKYIAYIKFRNIYRCAVVLISYKHVATASRCTYDLVNPDFGKATIIVATLCTKNNCDGYPIKNIHTPSIMYLPAPASYYLAEISIILLYKEFPKEHVSPISLDDSHHVDSGTEASVAGWGSIKLPEFLKNNNKTCLTLLHNLIPLKKLALSPDLKTLNVTVMSNYDCWVQRQETIDDTEMCAIASLKNNGILSIKDYGNPLVADEKLIGISIRCSQNLSSPAVYARISAYYTHIMRAMVRLQ